MDKNCQSTPSGKGKGSNRQQTSGGKGNQGKSSHGRSPENFKNRNDKSDSAKGSGGKGTFSRGKGLSSGEISGHSTGMSAGKVEETSQGTKSGQRKGSSAQRKPHPGRGESVHQVAGSQEDYYNNVTTQGEDAPDKEGNLGEESLGEQWGDKDSSWETVHQEYKGDYQE